MLAQHKKNYRYKGKTLRLFVYAQIVIVTSFSILMAFTINTMSDVRDVLLQLIEKDVPVITQTALLNNQVNRLATLTANLTNSLSEPARNLARKQIDETVDGLLNVIKDKNGQSHFIERQMSVISQEIDELEYLVRQRIVVEELFSRALERFYIDKFNLLSTFKASNENFQVNQYLIDIIELSVQIERQERLHLLRQTERQLNEAFELAIEQANATKNQQLLDGLNKLSKQITGESGLFNQKIESLRIIGRARGRDNFVRNLIGDVARNLEQQTLLVNRATKNRSLKASDQVKEQTTLTIAVGLLLIFITLTIIVFLYRRIVSRLLSLSRQVDLASEDKIDTIEISGNDEITNLSENFSIFLSKVKEQEKALRSLSLSDPLTGIPNRRAFEKQLEFSMAQARRNSWTLSLMMVDVDYFKLFNDHYGHSEGDACLRLVANQLNQMALRNTDFCARFGGEEFVCILPNTDNTGARQKAEELRQSIERLCIEHVKSDICDCVTVSIGVATLPFNSNSSWLPTTVIEQADKALYSAKENGRNQCSFFTVT